MTGLVQADPGARFEACPVGNRLKDLKGEHIEGIWYREQLQKVSGPTQPDLVETIVKRQKGWALVKWLGFNDKFNSWVKLKDLKNL